MGAVLAQKVAICLTSESRGGNSRNIIR